MPRLRKALVSLDADPYFYCSSRWLYLTGSARSFAAEPQNWRS
ncbi:MAG: hypothetical protein ACI8XX_001568 [Polaribacter sp.]|jgi:hypothetical protein